MPSFGVVLCEGLDLVPIRRREEGPQTVIVWLLSGSLDELEDRLGFAVPGAAFGRNQSWRKQLQSHCAGICAWREEIEG